MKNLALFVLLLITAKCFSQTLSVNPPVFNQSTAIRFTSTSPDTATLMVFDRWGDLVETFFTDTFLPPANYSFTLQGDTLNDGVYIVHLILGNRSYNINAFKQGVNSISDIYDNVSLGCYPSPSNGSFIIDMTGYGAGEKQVNIYNQLGQVAYQTMCIQDKLQINEKLSSGVYTVTVSQATRQYSKIVIE